MTIERASEVMESVEYDYEQKNVIVQGLNIMAKYCEDVEIAADHDEIWAGPHDSDAIEHMSEEDLRELARLGWSIDDGDSFHHFT